MERKVKNVKDFTLAEPAEKSLMICQVLGNCPLCGSRADTQVNSHLGLLLPLSASMKSHFGGCGMAGTSIGEDGLYS